MLISAASTVPRFASVPMPEYAVLFVMMFPLKGNQFLLYS